MDAQKTINAITQKIEDGFVVNEHGRWLYMAEQRIYERRVIEQIVNGNVLVDGKWVSIGQAIRLSRRSKQAAAAQAATPTASTPTAPALHQAHPAHPAQRKPPHPAPFSPPHNETTSFEAVGDMMETICMDMSAIMRPPTPETAQYANTATDAEDDGHPTHVDSVLITGLTQNTAADQSRYAIAYIDELNFSRKRSGILGKLAKLSMALAAVAAAVLVIIHYVD